MLDGVMCSIVDECALSKRDAMQLISRALSAAYPLLQLPPGYSGDSREVFFKWRSANGRRPISDVRKLVCVAGRGRETIGAPP
jgi:hypothetical protein